MTRCFRTATTRYSTITAAYSRASSARCGALAPKSLTSFFRVHGQSISNWSKRGVPRAGASAPGACHIAWLVVEDAGGCAVVAEDGLAAQESHDRVRAGSGAAEARDAEAVGTDLAQLGEGQERVLDEHAARIHPFGDLPTFLLGAGNH